MKCGLLGRKLAHSYSPQIHSFLGNYSYDTFEKEPNELNLFFESNDFDCINVTIPYKKDVIPYCDVLSDCAQKMGAVNTIVCRADGKLIGHNTDYFGLHYTFNRMGISLNRKKVLVLGSGGASVTTVIVLRELGANVVIVSRTGENNYNNLHLHSDAAMIVNTTPVGMYPNAGISPVDLDMFSHLEGVLDIIYNPARTKLLLDAEERKIPCENGLWMLVAQAKESAEWFMDTKISDDVIPDIYNKMCKKMENIVLIGMPGCGKSTIGKILAEKLGKTFVDADDEIIKRANTTISDIFATKGEEGFRKIETEVLAELGQRSNLVIATGGGCVTRIENYNFLHQNGTIYWIQRDISKLPTDGRPLSQRSNLSQMYITRKPLYEKFADKIIANDGSVNNAVNEIIRGQTI